MKTIINKLRYILLFGFIAMAALGSSLNAATITWSWVGANNGTTLPTGWTMTDPNYSQLVSNGDGTWYIGINADYATAQSITIPSSVFNGITPVTVVISAKKDDGVAATKTISVNNDSKTVTNEGTLANYTWENVSTTNGILIEPTDGYVGFASIIITGESTTEDATICDGTATNAYLPIYAYYYDNCQKNQMIYPESMLIAKDINAGATLKSMTFYVASNYSFNFSGGKVTLRLGTTTNQDHYTSRTRLQPSDMIIVASDFDVPSSGNTWTIEFTTPFEYNGGNLVVDVEETSYTSGSGHYGTYGFSFYGVSQTGGGFNSNGTPYNSTFSTLYTSGDVRNFLPKVTFTYEAKADPVTNGTVTPNAVDFGAIIVGNSAPTQTVTISNTGNQPFTPVIDATNLPQGITVSPTTSGQLAAGGTLNLTVGFTPTAETSYSGSFTVTIPVPDEEGDDIVVTVNVTGSGYVAISTLTSNTAEIPVYKSEAKAPSATYVFSRNDVEDDIDMSLSYGGNADVKVDVLVKDDEPISGYDLRHKVGSGNWASAATATQDASNPKSYVYNNDTFVIPSDASQMWLSMTDAGADASSTISYVPVTVANGVVTQGNTYGAPQVQATNDPISFIVSVGGSKSAGRPGGHWDQNGVDYCIYTPVVTIANINPAFDGENRVPYLIRAWLLKNDNVPFYSIVRVANENDPDNSHIEAGNVLTYPYPLGEMYLESDMISEQYMIGHDWSGEGDDPWNNPWGDVEDFMENVFAAPSTMPTGEHMKIAVRIYYYKPSENVSGSQMLAANRDGEAPGDGYGYGEGEGNGEGIPTAVVGIYTDRQVVDVKYVNPQGMQSDRPFDGVNIIVTRYNDGSVTTSKVVK